MIITILLFALAIIMFSIGCYNHVKTNKMVNKMADYNNSLKSLNYKINEGES